MDDDDDSTKPGSAPDTITEAVNYGDDANPPPLTQPDVERYADGTIMMRLGTVEYVISEGTAHEWLRLFRDFLDGRNQNEKHLPDMEYLDNFYPNDTDIWTINISGPHNEQGDGWQIQTAYLDRELLAELVEKLDGALEESDTTESEGGPAR